MGVIYYAHTIRSVVFIIVINISNLAGMQSILVYCGQLLSFLIPSAPLNLASYINVMQKDASAVKSLLDAL